VFHHTLHHLFLHVFTTCHTLPATLTGSPHCTLPRCPPRVPHTCTLPWEEGYYFTLHPHFSHYCTTHLHLPHPCLPTAFPCHTTAMVPTVCWEEPFIPSQWPFPGPTHHHHLSAPYHTALPASGRFSWTYTHTCTGLQVDPTGTLPHLHTTTPLPPVTQSLPDSPYTHTSFPPASHIPHLASASTLLLRSPTWVLTLCTAHSFSTLHTTLHLTDSVDLQWCSDSPPGTLPAPFPHLPTHHHVAIRQSLGGHTHHTHTTHHQLPHLPYYTLHLHLWVPTCPHFHWVLLPHTGFAHCTLTCTACHLPLCTAPPHLSCLCLPPLPPPSSFPTWVPLSPLPPYTPLHSARLHTHLHHTTHLGGYPHCFSCLPCTVPCLPLYSPPHTAPHHTPPGAHHCTLTSPRTTHHHTTLPPFTLPGITCLHTSLHHHTTLHCTPFTALTLHPLPPTPTHTQVSSPVPRSRGHTPAICFPTQSPSLHLGPCSTHPAPTVTASFLFYTHTHYTLSLPSHWDYFLSLYTHFSPTAPHSAPPHCCTHIHLLSHTTLPLSLPLTLGFFHTHYTPAPAYIFTTHHLLGLPRSPFLHTGCLHFIQCQWVHCSHHLPPPPPCTHTLHTLTHTSLPCLLTPYHPGGPSHCHHLVVPTGLLLFLFLHAYLWVFTPPSALLPAPTFFPASLSFSCFHTTCTSLTFSYCTPALPSATHCRDHCLNFITLLFYTGSYPPALLQFSSRTSAYLTCTAGSCWVSYSLYSHHPLHYHSLPAPTSWTCPTALGWSLPGSLGLTSSLPRFPPSCLPPLGSCTHYLPLHTRFSGFHTDALTGLHTCTPAHPHTTAHTTPHFTCPCTTAHTLSSPPGYTYPPHRLHLPAACHTHTPSGAPAQVGVSFPFLPGWNSHLGLIPTTTTLPPRSFHSHGAVSLGTSPFPRTSSSPPCSSLTSPTATLLFHCIGLPAPHTDHSPTAACTTFHYLSVHLPSAFSCLHTVLLHSWVPPHSFSPLGSTLWVFIRFGKWADFPRVQIYHHTPFPHHLTPWHGGCTTNSHPHLGGCWVPAPLPAPSP